MASSGDGPRVPPSGRPRFPHLIGLESVSLSLASGHIQTPGIQRSN